MGPLSYAHPASIQTRVGSCLAYIERNIEQTDYAGLSNFVKLLERYTAPYKAEEPKLWAELKAIPPFAYDPKVSESDAFDRLMERVEICLTILRKKNIYGYDAAPMGDGSALQLPEEETEATA